jgi:hypothetical protein
MEGLAYNLYSIMSLLTPVRSEVLHVNMSLFLSRNESNSVSSSTVKSWEIITALSGTLWSSGTLLVLYYGSIGLLVELPSLSFLAMLLRSSSFSSCKQFTFLWPGVKPCSMFLASFLLP